MIESYDCWKPGTKIDVEAGSLTPYGGRMVRLTLKRGSLTLYNRLRSDPYNLCPEPKTTWTLLYDFSRHSEIMAVVNGGTAPRLSRLMKKGMNLETANQTA